MPTFYERIREEKITIRKVEAKTQEEADSLFQQYRSTPIYINDKVIGIENISEDEANKVIYKR